MLSGIWIWIIAMGVDRGVQLRVCVAGQPVLGGIGAGDLDRGGAGVVRVCRGEANLFGDRVRPSRRAARTGTTSSASRSPVPCSSSSAQSSSRRWRPVVHRNAGRRQSRALPVWLLKLYVHFSFLEMRTRRVEPGDGVKDGGPHGGAAGMAGVFDDRQFSVRPGLSQFPRREQWPRQVEASMDQDSRNTLEAVRISQQLISSSHTPWAK